MSDIPGTTRAQTIFLRAFRNQPSGPSTKDWPSPAILRRWLRRPGFIAALRSLTTTMRAQADFQLVSAAAAAAHGLHAALLNTEDPQQRNQIKAMSDLLKLSHMRQRFGADTLPKPAPRNANLLSALRTAHPNVTIRQFFELSKQLGFDWGIELKDPAVEKYPVSKTDEN